MDQLDSAGALHSLRNGVEDEIILKEKALKARYDREKKNDESELEKDNGKSFEILPQIFNNEDKQLNSAKMEKFDEIIKDYDSQIKDDIFNPHESIERALEKKHEKEMQELKEYEDKREELRQKRSASIDFNKDICRFISNYRLLMSSWKITKGN